MLGLRENAMSKSFNEQAASLVENALNLIKQVLIKHSAAVLEEMHDQIVSRNDRIRQLEKENYAMMSDTNEYREVLRVLGMEEEGSAVQEILRLLKAEADLRTERDYLRAKFGELRSAAEQVLDDWANENVVRCDSRQQVERVLNSVASL